MGTSTAARLRVAAAVVPTVVLMLLVVQPWAAASSSPEEVHLPGLPASWPGGEEPTADVQPPEHVIARLAQAGAEMSPAENAAFLRVATDLDTSRLHPAGRLGDVAQYVAPDPGGERLCVAAAGPTIPLHDLPVSVSCDAPAAVARSGLVIVTQWQLGPQLSDGLATRVGVIVPDGFDDTLELSFESDAEVAHAANWFGMAFDHELPAVDGVLTVSGELRSIDIRLPFSALAQPTGDWLTQQAPAVD